LSIPVILNTIITKA